MKVQVLSFAVNKVSILTIKLLFDWKHPVPLKHLAPVWMELGLFA